MFVLHRIQLDFDYFSYKCHFYEKECLTYKIIKTLENI